MYHCVFPTDYEDQPVHWSLYDAGALTAKAHAHEVPLYIADTVCSDLHMHNFLYHTYEHFATFQPDENQAHMELSLANPGHGDEVVALYHVGSAPRPSPHTLYVQCSCKHYEPKGVCIPIPHALYEPLQYPLLFPEGTRGWGLDMHAEGWTQRKYYKACLLTEPHFQEPSHLG
jgi:hypothetical protein